MARKKKQTYTEELKRQVAAQVTAGNEAGIIAAEHGISLGSVRNWARQFGAGGNGEVPKPKTGNGKVAKANGSSAVNAIRAEIKQHEAAVARLKRAEAHLSQ